MMNNYLLINNIKEIKNRKIGKIQRCQDYLLEELEEVINNNLVSHKDLH